MQAQIDQKQIFRFSDINQYKKKSSLSGLSDNLYIQEPGIGSKVNAHFDDNKAVFRHSSTFLLLIGFLNIMLIFRFTAEYFLTNYFSLKYSIFLGESSISFFLLFLKLFLFCFLIILLRKTMENTASFIGPLFPSKKVMKSSSYNNKKSDKNKGSTVYTQFGGEIAFGIIAFLGVMFLIFIIQGLAGDIFSLFKQLNFEGSSYYSFLTTGSVLLFSMRMLLSGIVSPVIEEIIFRGYLFQTIKLWLDKYNAVWITTLIFTLYHLPYTGFSSSIGYILFNGFLLGILRMKTRSILPPIICHSLWNITILLYSA